MASLETSIPFVLVIFLLSLSTKVVHGETVYIDTLHLGEPSLSISHPIVHLGSSNWSWYTQTAYPDTTWFVLFHSAQRASKKTELLLTEWHQSYQKLSPYVRMAIVDILDETLLSHRLGIYQNQIVIIYPSSDKYHYFQGPITSKSIQDVASKSYSTKKWHTISTVSEFERAHASFYPKPIKEKTKIFILSPIGQPLDIRYKFLATKFNDQVSWFQVHLPSILPSSKIPSSSVKLRAYLERNFHITATTDAILFNDPEDLTQYHLWDPTQFFQHYQLYDVASDPRRTNSSVLGKNDTTHSDLDQVTEVAHLVALERWIFIHELAPLLQVSPSTFFHLVSPDRHCFLILINQQEGAKFLQMIKNTIKGTVKQWQQCHDNQIILAPLKPLLFLWTNTSPSILKDLNPPSSHSLLIIIDKQKLGYIVEPKDLMMMTPQDITKILIEMNSPMRPNSGIYNKLNWQPLASLQKRLTQSEETPLLSPSQTSYEWLKKFFSTLFILIGLSIVVLYRLNS